MKKFLIILLSAGIVFTSFYSCKKGENDPFFSFRTRKARMVGNWDISNYSENIKTVYDNGESNNRELKITGTKVKEIIDYINTVHDTSITTSGEINDFNLRIDKDGIADLTMNYTLVKDSSGTDDNTGLTYSTTTTRIYKTRAKGTWNFLAGIDNFKNKERLSLVWETYNTSLNTVLLRVITDDNGVETRTNYSDISATEHKYANGESAEVWTINELKNKEIILLQDVNFLEVATDSTGGTTTQETGSKSMTLTQL